MTARVEHPLNLPYGLHLDIESSRYHHPALGVVSKSALDQVHRSPLHYRQWLNSPTAETPVLAFGRAFHCAALEPDVFASDYVVQPDFGDMRSSKRRAERDAWREENAGRQIITADDLATIQGMIKALRAHPLASQMLTGGQAEVTLTWRDEVTGLGCRSRADYYVQDRAMVVDLKTTQDASLDAFRKSIANYRYHVQDALYRDAFAQVGEPVQYFAMVAVEKAPPYGVAVYTLDEEGIAKGYTAARQDIELLAHAVEHDDWSGYPAHIHTIDLPPWAA